MAEKVINTRLQLKYDTLENWTKVASTFTPKKGEVCFVEVADNADPIHNAPSILFKVGDGKSTFEALKWGSGLAADVYSWAKAATKPSYSYSEISGTPAIPTVGNGKITITQNGTVMGSFTVNQSGPATIEVKDTNTDTNTSYQLVLSGHTLKLQSKEKGASAWTDVTGQSFTLPDNNTTYTFATGSTNGTISVTPSGGSATDVKVKGLGSAAYTNSGAYATATQGTKADNALPKADFDTFKTANTTAIADAKKAGTDASAALTSYKTSNDKAVQKNATDISNLQTAVKAGITFKGKLDELPATTAYENGDLIIVGNKEYILYADKSGKSWIELGDEGSHLTKATADGYYVPLSRKINGKSLGSDISVGTVTSVGTGEGLTGGSITSSGTISHAAPTGAKTTASGFYKVATDKFGHVTGTTAVTKADITALGIPGADTNTHYITGLYVGATNVKSNAATTNGSTFLKLYDDNTKRAEFKISGSGATTVTSDASGNIVISSTDTNTQRTDAEIKNLAEAQIKTHNGVDKTGTVTSVQIKGSTYVKVDNDAAITQSGTRTISLSDKVLTQDDVLIFDCGDSTRNI